MNIPHIRGLEGRVDEFRKLGICTTCNHLHSCSRRRFQRFTIWHCEDFENTCPDSARYGINPLEKEDQKETLTNEFKGLCASCTLRKVCISPMSEGGVWHCDEYQ